MRRREFVASVGAAIAARAVGAKAESALPVIGFLRSTPAAPFTHIVAAFRRGLNEMGFFDRQNVAIEQRWADNRLDQLPSLAADLVHRHAAVMVVNGPAVEAARSAAASMP